MQVKKFRHRRLQVVLLHLHEIFRKGKLETESRLVIARGYREDLGSNSIVDTGFPSE